MDLKQFIDFVDVENNFAFLPRDGLTFCNCYAKVVLAHQGVYIPSLKVNDLYDWFLSKTKWVENPTSPFDAFIAIAKHDPHGHIAVGVDHQNGIYTSAGSRNHKFCSLNQAFGSLNPTILYHVL